MGPVALLIALVSIATAVWALRTASADAPESASHMAAMQPADAKAQICGAFDTVSKAVSLQTHAELGTDQVAQAAVAGNARLSLLGGGQYLLSRLNPGTPSELADAVRAFANDLQDIGMNALAGLPNSDPAQSARMGQGDLNRQTVYNLCK